MRSAPRRPAPAPRCRSGVRPWSAQRGGRASRAGAAGAGLRHPVHPARYVVSPMYGRVSRAWARPTARPAWGAPSATAASTAARSATNSPRRRILLRADRTPRETAARPAASRRWHPRASGVGARKAAHAPMTSSSAARVSRAHAFVYGNSRNCSAVSSPRPPKRAMPRYFAYADQGDALGGNAQTGQAGEDFGDLRLVIQVASNHSTYSPSRLASGPLIPLGELAHRLGALHALVAREIVGPDPAQLGRRDLRHRPLVQDIAPVDHAPRSRSPARRWRRRC